ncbi:hypothetical protein GCM10027028_13300 [Streptomyces sundarbansensis]
MRPGAYPLPGEAVPGSDDAGDTGDAPVAPCSGRGGNKMRGLWRPAILGEPRVTAPERAARQAARVSPGSVAYPSAGTRRVDPIGRTSPRPLSSVEGEAPWSARWE